MRSIDQKLELLTENYDFLRTYIEQAPLPLAIERVYECQILTNERWTRPCLDVGSGDGIFVHILFGTEVDVGIDINEKELERSRALNVYNDLMKCSAAQMPFKDGHFQTVFSNSVLEHIPSLEPVLKEIHRVLADSGRVYLTLPTNYFDRHTVAYKLLAMLAPPLAERFRVFFNSFWNHFHYYSVQEWTALFESCGFQVQRSQTYGSAWSCHLNNFLTVFSVPTAISRKFFKRWFVFPGLRKLYTPILCFFFRFLIDSPNRKPKADDGLVFFHLIKK